MSAPSTPLRSRCTVRADPPRQWVDYIDHAHPSSVALVAWLDGLTLVVREVVEETIQALVDRAASGEIAEDDDRSLVVVGSFPQMWELRWAFRAAGKNVQVRQYHLEPAALPNHLVSLHRHIKSTRGTRAAIKDAQNQEISQAQLRSIMGNPSNWGTTA